MLLLQVEPREKEIERFRWMSLDERVKPILWKLCENKKADEFVFVNPKPRSLTRMSKGHSVRRAN
jgi:hypothetical protein